MTIATIGGALSSKPVSGFAEKSTKEYVEVKTAYGRIRGLRQGDLVTFKGIPYAGSVSEANRFRAAPPLQPWTGVKDTGKGMSLSRYGFLPVTRRKSFHLRTQT